MGKGFFIGVDGGGTGSRVLVVFQDNRAPVKLVAGPLNVCSVHVDEIEITLSRLLMQIDQVTGGLTNCLGVGIGMAGFSNPKAEPLLRTLVERYLPSDTIVRIVSDAMAALYGAHQCDRGLVLISGTGSVCFGVNGEISHQVGGAGHLIDDEGSGYAIGRDILSAVVKSLDGRIMSTVLCNSLAGQYSLTKKEDIIAWVYAPGTTKSNIAALTPLLTDACRADDTVAKSIAEKAATQLLALVEANTRILGMPKGPLALSGSVLLKEPFVRKVFMEKLIQVLPRMTIYDAKTDAASGAILIVQKAREEQFQ